VRCGCHCSGGCPSTRQFCMAAAAVVFCSPAASERPSSVSSRMQMSRYPLMHDSVCGGGRAAQCSTALCTSCIAREAVKRHGSRLIVMQSQLIVMHSRIRLEALYEGVGPFLSNAGHSAALGSGSSHVICLLCACMRDACVPSCTMAGSPCCPFTALTSHSCQSASASCSVACVYWHPLLVDCSV
jgi:hypothetical protein